MNANGLPPEPPGRQFFNEKRNLYPPDDLVQYINQYIAWTADGTRIVTSGATWDEVENRLAAMGVPGNQIVFEFFPDPDVIYL